MDENSQSKCLSQNVLPDGLEIRLSDRLAHQPLVELLGQAGLLYSL